MYNCYNTGDQVWQEWDGKQYVVSKIVSHDGIVYDWREKGLTRLTGMDMVVHRATVFCLKAIHKLLNA